VIPARILPGWMNLDEVVSLLVDHCSPPWSPEDARSLWLEHSKQVDGDREPYDEWPLLELEPPELEYADRFMDFLRSHTRESLQIERVVKVPIRFLVASQHIAITERTHDYAAMQVDETSWWSELLPIRPPAPKIGMRVTFGQPDNPTPLDTRILFDLPDAEFAFLPHGGGLFGIAQLPRHVTVVRCPVGLILKNGYHRLIAKLRNASYHTEPSALVALEASSAANAEQSVQFLPKDARRPARLADFVTEGQFVDVSLKRKRYQIEVQAGWRALDDV
jgi:hypothetical protein